MGNSSTVEVQIPVDHLPEPCAETQASRTAPADRLAAIQRLQQRRLDLRRLQLEQLQRLEQLRRLELDDGFLDDFHALRFPEFQTTRETKFYDLKDTAFTFTNKEDEFDFLCEEFKSPRALMSCGHAVTPTSLTNWCRKQLDEGGTTFMCGQTSCNVEWSYEEVCRMALLTPQEKMHFEKALKANVEINNTKACPGCNSPVVESDQSNLRVRCKVCTSRNGRIYYFCWQCLREWRGPDSSPDHCDNHGCNDSLKTLRMCPLITQTFLRFPSIRACPSCGILLQHNKRGCSNVTCHRCKVNFCFVCLKTPCSQCSLAPRQTSIPVWKKK